jgi:hypothetical protein
MVLASSGDARRERLLSGKHNLEPSRWITLSPFTERHTFVISNKIRKIERELRIQKLTVKPRLAELGDGASQVGQAVKTGITSSIPPVVTLAKNVAGMVAGVGTALNDTWSDLVTLSTPSSFEKLWGPLNPSDEQRALSRHPPKDS